MYFENRIYSPQIKKTTAKSLGFTSFNTTQNTKNADEVWVRFLDGLCYKLCEDKTVEQVMLPYLFRSGYTIACKLK